jgi:hypothetical protein
MIEADHGAMHDFIPHGKCGEISIGLFMSRVLVPEVLAVADSMASRLAKSDTIRSVPSAALGRRLRHRSYSSRSKLVLHTIDRNTRQEPNGIHRHDDHDDDDDDSRLQSPKRLPTSSRSCTSPSQTFSKRNSSQLLQ